jgi:hypothetical protein
MGNSWLRRYGDYILERYRQIQYSTQWVAPATLHPQMCRGLLLLVMALLHFCCALASSSVSACYTQSVGLLGWEIGPSQGPKPTHSSRQIEHKHTSIHASSGIRTHDHSNRASEHSSCLRPSGNCDRQWKIIKKLRGLSPRANYTDRATAACRRK